MTTTPPSSDIARLRDQKYINLTTFRKNGAAVVTPVWFGQDGARLYVLTGHNAGKIKRIRNNGRVQIGPSDQRGRPTGPVAEAHATILPSERGRYVEDLLTRKYGLAKRGFDLVAMIGGIVRRRQGPARDYLEITLS